MLEILINIGNIVSPIFYKLLYMSIIGTILGILILIITELFDNKISSKWKCLMWIIPLIFLMIPIQRIEIKTNNNIPMVSAVDKVEDIFSSIEPSDYQTIETSSNKLNQEYKTQLDEIYNTTNKKQDVGDFIVHIIIPILWLLGSAIGITIFVISNIGLINKIKRTEKLKNYRIKAIQRECKRKLKINKKIEIRIQKLKGSPCIYGIMHPKILVPEDFEEKEDQIIENVFMHELSHYKRKDMVTNCILLVMTAIHWFNPFVYAFFKKMRQEMELATDEIALSKMNKEEKKKYGLTLINLLETYQGEEIGAKMLCITDDSKNMQKRIMRIKNSGKKAHRIIGALAVLMIAVITLPFMVQATTTINNKENIKIELEKVMNSEKSFITEGSYEMLINDYEIMDGKYEINSFAYIDLDNDGVEELVTLISDYLAYMIFHYEDGNVYGYILGIRMLEELKTDGTFMGSSGANYNEYLRISFDKNTYKLENIDITEEEFEQKENKTFIKYNDKNENSLNQQTQNINSSNVENNIADKLEGKWIPFMAMHNQERVPLMDIYGSGMLIYEGNLNFNSDGTYTKFIGIYDDNIEDLRGVYQIYGNTIFIKSNSGIEEKLEYIDNEEQIIKETLKDGIDIYFKQYNNQDLDVIAKQIIENEE